MTLTFATLGLYVDNALTAAGLDSADMDASISTRADYPHITIMRCAGNLTAVEAKDLAGALGLKDAEPSTDAGRPGDRFCVIHGRTSTGLRIDIHRESQDVAA